MRSELFYIEPSNIEFDISKIDDSIIKQFWYLDNKDKDTLENIFMYHLNDVKLYNYLTLKYKKMINYLFKSIFEQNKDLVIMKWHFKCSNFIYYLSINKIDIERQEYPVKIIESYNIPLCDTDTYLKIYPEYMKQSEFILKKNNLKQEKSLEQLLENPKIFFDLLNR